MLVASPDLETVRRISRLKLEAIAVAQRFGEANFDRQDGAWLHVPEFKLPAGWNKGAVEILIDVPWSTPGYPAVAPQWFWTDRDLATQQGVQVQHFFTGDQSTKHDDMGWGHFCVHMNDWHPASGFNLTAGHSLLTYLNLIWTIFHDHRTLSGG